jgi:glyoxylase-like metal-dependent hydrolase (beta-lactamase superfamily II)
MNHRLISASETPPTTQFMSNNTLSIGDIDVDFVSGGRLRIDGGNMFGVVPRVMWERVSPPDAEHRIALDTNCVLVRTANSLGLIDTGYGGKATPRFQQRHALEDGEPLVRNLAAAGISPEQIDWVILTHLHFDHAGGATLRNEHGPVVPTFPRARHFIQRAEWEDAIAQLPELAGAYHLDDIRPLEAAGLVQLVEGDADVVPGVHVQLTGGHTRGHQIVRIESGDASAVLLADICPTAGHLPAFWTMAYDQFPLDVRRVKPRVLNDMVDQKRIALFSHDPRVLVVHLTCGEKGELVANPIRTR